MRTSSIEEEIEQNGSLCYTTRGVSMLPLLREKRDLVIIKRPEGRLHRLDVALYKSESGKYLLHRVLKVRKDDYVICGDNCIRREIGIKDAQIIGVMTDFVRDGKKTSVTAPCYRLYSRLVSDLYLPKAAALRLKRRVVSLMKKTKSGA